MKDEYQEILNRVEEAHENKSEKSKNDKILVVDGLNTFIRSFAVSPTRNQKGIHIGGIGGCLKSIGSAIRKFSPTRCIVVFDGKGGSKRRKKIFGDYKSGRSGKDYNRYYDFEDEDEDEAMRREIVRTVEYLNCLPVTLMSIDHIEADDVIAYLSQQVYEDDDHEVIVMSTDKDFLQLVNDSTKVWSPTKKTLYEVEDVLEEYQVPPRNFVIWRMIDGDKSDSIPGVHGIGEKRVQKHLGEIVHDDDPQTVDDVIEYSKERLDESRIYEKVVDNEDVLRRNWKLMQLYDVNISAENKSQIIDIAQQEIPKLDKQCFRELFMKDQMWAAINGMDSWLKTTFADLNRMRKRDQ